MKTKKLSVFDQKNTPPLGGEELNLLKGKLIISGSNLRLWLMGNGDVHNGYNALVGRRNGRRADQIRESARRTIASL